MLPITLLLSVSRNSCFNLRREAAPHATTKLPGKPNIKLCFNLRREAAPHATSRNHPMPNLNLSSFNIRREATPHATERKNHGKFGKSRLFQSQTRSRSTCDLSQPCMVGLVISVSISDEKPLHMRRKHSLGESC